MKREFPEVELAEQVDKLTAIEKLERSGSFATTHAVVEKLTKYDDFTDGEAARILEAYHSNRQVYLIINDSDVEEFAKKIITFAKKESTKELAEKLAEIVSDIKKDSDDIPF